MGVMETPQHTKENDYFRTKAKSTIQITSFAYPKEEKKKGGERAKKKEKKKVGIYKMTKFGYKISCNLMQQLPFKKLILLHSLKI